MTETSQMNNINQAPNRSVRRRSGWISAILAAVIVAVLAVLLIAVKTQGYAKLFGRSVFRVATGSMEPTIRIGALLMAEDCGIDQIQVGDIVCFRSEDGDTRDWVITHRVVSVLKSGDGDTVLETKGDANGAVDSRYVTRENLIGKVTWYTGEGNLLSSGIGFLTSGFGFLTLIILPCLFISGLLLSRSVRQIRKDIARLQEEADREPLKPEEMEALRRKIKEELLAQRESMLAEIEDQMQQGDENEGQPEQVHKEQGEGKDTGAAGGAED